MTSTETRRRGGALTTLLVVLTLAQALLLIAILRAWGYAESHGRSVDGLILGGVLMSLLALAAYGGVWAWRRWGVVMAAILAAVGVLADLAAGMSPVVLLIRVALLTTFFWAVSRRWEDFR